MRVRPDHEVAVGTSPDRQAAWIRPTLRRLDAGKAENLASNSGDGVSTQS